MFLLSLLPLTFSLGNVLFYLFSFYYFFTLVQKCLLVQISLCANCLHAHLTRSFRFYIFQKNISFLALKVIFIHEIICKCLWRFSFCIKTGCWFCFQKIWFKKTKELISFVNKNIKKLYWKNILLLFLYNKKFKTNARINLKFVVCSQS